MTVAGWRADTLELLAQNPSPARRFLAVGTLALMVGTAVVYSLPLAQETDDVVSNAMFAVVVLVAVVVSGQRARRHDGAERLAWGLVAGSFAITALLFALDPQSSDGDLSIALNFGFVISLAYWVAMIVLTAPALPGLASLRTAADALWATTAVIVAVWPWTLGPLLAAEGPSTAERGLHVVFGISTIAFGTSVLVILPHTAGRARVSLWFLGVGGAIASAAGVFHIRFHYEGTLRFGSWWDYLWTLGVGALTLGGLADSSDELRPRRRNATWHAVLTVVPLVFAATALITSEPDTAHIVGAVALLAALAFRVIALTAENDRLTRSLTNEANNDPLTGLGNRRALESGIGRIGATARDQRRLRAVVVLDLDHFKEVNDSHGHLVGDEVLKIVARRLRDAVRDRDLLARHGGDEFVAVMIVRDEQEAIHAAERLRVAVRGRYALPVGNLVIDATMGVAIDVGDVGMTEIMAIADEALYTAKAAARGSVHLEVCEPVSVDRVHHLPDE